MLKQLPNQLRQKESRGERDKGREEVRKEGREWKEAEGEGGVRMQKRGKEGEEDGSEYREV